MPSCRRRRAQTVRSARWSSSARASTRARSAISARACASSRSTCPKRSRRSVSCNHALFHPPLRPSALRESFHPCAAERDAKGARPAAADEVQRAPSVGHSTFARPPPRATRLLRGRCVDPPPAARAGVVHERYRDEVDPTVRLPTRLGFDLNDCEQVSLLDKLEAEHGLQRGVPTLFISEAQ
eukprot:7039083-Prymnesium_polylepis.1